MIIAAIVIGIPSAGLLFYAGFKAGYAWCWQVNVKPMLDAVGDWREEKRKAAELEPRREDQQP